MNHESLPLFSLEGQENSKQKESLLERKVGATKKILKQLAFWGFLSIAALEGSSLGEASVAMDSGDLGAGQEKAENIKNPNLQKAKKIEIELKERAQGREAGSERPVVAIVAKSDLERFDDKSMARNTLEAYTREMLITQAVQKNSERLAFVDRSENTMQAIEAEISLETQSSDLFNPETVTESKHLNPDYYVVVSEERMGNNVVLEVEIINMKDGSMKKIAASKEIAASGSVITEDESGFVKDTIEEVNNVLEKI